MRVWGGQYREELILKFTVFVVRVWRGQYREELILNVTVFFVRVWVEPDTEYYFASCEVLAEGNIEILLRVAINCCPDQPV